MSFLQPILLAALPVIFLPVVIHLINQRRYQTMRWAAMMFLLAANRMSRGYARLRQWLILLFRMLAIAGLVFAISRPLASGWLGLAAGSGADTTMVLLDRSPSMQEQRAGLAGSKLETGRGQLARTLNLLGSARWVLIESTRKTPSELESPDALLRMPAGEPAGSSADLPGMLEAVHDYLRSNQPGRTEIWICSDLRENDWNPEDGRWQKLREAFLRTSQGLRFHLLAYPESAPENISLRVTEVRHRQAGDSSELLVSLRLTRSGAAASPPPPPGGDGDSSKTAGGWTGNDSRAALRTSVPIQFDLEGARSEVTIEMTGPQFELKDHRIPLDRNHQRGWGMVSVPADANPADNDFYFVFDRPVERQTVVLAEDGQAARPLQLAAMIPPDPALRCSAEVLTSEQAPSIDWEKASLVLWQAPLPGGETARRVQAFADRGGAVVFFPPRAPTNDAFAGVRWQSWAEAREGFAVATWRGDQDLLANTQSGAALPAGGLEIRRYCALSGEHTPLAMLKGGASLLGRATGHGGGVYFCATTPAPTDSSLAANGVVLYAMVQRALAAGSSTLGTTRQLVAGDASAEPGVRVGDWRRLAGRSEAISTEFAFHPGVYQAGDKLFAVNRAEGEDRSPVLADQRVSALFRGLDFARVDDRAGSIASLIDEIWRPFLAAMIAFLILEAVLCLPRNQAIEGARGAGTP